MSPFYIYNNKFLMGQNGLAASQDCCCCKECSGPTCCGNEWPRTTGECCGGQWRLPTDTSGVCCGGQWYPNNPADPGYVAGQCCGNVWRTEPGQCCANTTWHPDANPCSGAGEIFLRWPDATDGPCCGCVAEKTNLPIIGEVNTADYINTLCCPVCPNGPLLPSGSDQCLGRCCTEGQGCVERTLSECLGIPNSNWLPGCCDSLGCPVKCCETTEQGFVNCSENINSVDCTQPKQIVNSCEECVGYCCKCNEQTKSLVNLDPTQMTKSQCDNLGGILRSDPNCPSCAGGSDCCETKQSSGAGLTFTKPGQFCDTAKVRVVGTTDSPVLIHGIAFGEDSDPPRRCPIDHTFLVCWDQFNIEPIPCGSSFHNIDVEVCWSQEHTDSEILNFSGCNNITIKLGYCPYNCATSLSYSGSGHNSNANIVLGGNSGIQANGTGPLVLSGNITTGSSCISNFFITGNSTHNNEISGAIQNSLSTDMIVRKRGSGLWKLSGNNTFTKGIKVENGTLVIGQSVDITSSGPVGKDEQPVIGTSTTGAKFLLNGVTMGRPIVVLAGTGTVVLGGIGENASFFLGSRTIKLGRNVTLQASTGGEVTFGSLWQDVSGGPDPAVTFTIGSAGNEGTVMLDSSLPSSATGVNVVVGRLKILQNDTIGTETPTTIQNATFDYNSYNQSLDNLIITGTATLTGDNSSVLTVSQSLSGSGNIINSSGQLIINGTNTMNGSISISGGEIIVNQIVSGPALVTSANFTSTTLTINFNNEPNSGDQFKLLEGSTVQQYNAGSLVLNGTNKTGTYNSATSTLSID